MIIDSLTHQLLRFQNECSLSWIKRDGSPASAIVSYVFMDGKLWMTAQAGSPRINAIQRNAKVSVTISGKGCEVGHSRCVSIQGRCEIQAGATDRDRFFAAFSRAVLPGSESGASRMEQMMNTPDNLVLSLSPNKMIPYDAHDMLEQANKA